MTVLGPIDWTICIGYLGVVVALGLWFAHEQHTNEDFFVGGRRMHWLPIGLSLFAGTFSSLSFVGLPSEAAYKDYHLYLAILFIPVIVSPIIWWLFLPIYFRLGVTSAYEYVERRFDRRLRHFCSVLFMLYSLGWMGNLLRAVGVILQAVFDLSQPQTALLLVGVGLFATFYTALGGVKAVVWTDVLQAVALGGGMVVVLLMAVAKVEDGWSSVWRIGVEHDRFAMFRTTFDLEHGNLYAAVAFGIFVYLASHAVSFTAVQRFMSMPNISAAGWSLVVNGVMVAVVCGIFFLVGSTLFAFYEQQSVRLGERAPVEQVADVGAGAEHASAGAGTLYEECETEGHEDQLLPRFVMTEIPLPGLVGLLMAGLFAAAMSSVDSGINSMTATVVCDWQANRHMGLRQSRWLCAVFGALAAGIAVTFYYYGGNVFPLIMKIAGMFFGLMLGVFLLGMLVPRANTEGVKIGLAAGVIALSSTFVFDISHWWFGAVTCVPTFVVGYLASFRFPPPDSTKLHGLLAWGESE